MKRFGVICTLVAVSFILASPVFSAEPWALYDDFSSNHLKASKWVTEVQGGKLLGRETIIQQQDGVLRMGSIAHGGTASDTSKISGGERAYFMNASAVTQIKANVNVVKFKQTECVANKAGEDAYAAIDGYFFNPAPPVDKADITGDIMAGIRVGKTSDPTVPAGNLEIVARVLQNSNATGTATTSLFQKKMGTVALGQKVKLVTTWDQANHQFIFQVGKQTPEVYQYDPLVLPDTMPANGSENKRLRTYVAQENCLSGPQTKGVILVDFDNVFVNASAVPVP